MKRKYKVISILVCAVVLFSAIISNKLTKDVQAATVGQQLTAPESGWKRLDDSDTKIRYEGTWEVLTFNGNYNNQYHSGGNGSSYSFKFYGTKFRLIQYVRSTITDNVTINIDNTSENKSFVYSGVDGFQYIVYEKTNLGLGMHTVTVTNNDDGKEFFLDALDIDDSGYLVDYPKVSATGVTLNKSTDTLTLNAHDILVAIVTPEDATNRTVRWTSSNTDVATVNETTGEVTAVSVGTATITATTLDGTNLSASCEVKVVEASKNMAVLTITMTNNDHKEYNMYASEVDKFVEWYNANSSRSYKFDKSVVNTPYSSKVEYITHDEISSFEISEYTASN